MAAESVYNRVYDWAGWIKTKVAKLQRNGGAEDMALVADPKQTVEAVDPAAPSEPAAPTEPVEPSELEADEFILISHSDSDSSDSSESDHLDAPAHTSNTKSKPNPSCPIDQISDAESDVDDVSDAESCESFDCLEECYVKARVVPSFSKQVVEEVEEAGAVDIPAPSSTSTQPPETTNTKTIKEIAQPVQTAPGLWSYIDRHTTILPRDEQQVVVNTMEMHDHDHEQERVHEQQELTKQHAQLQYQLKIAKQEERILGQRLAAQQRGTRQQWRAQIDVGGFTATDIHVAAQGVRQNGQTAEYGAEQFVEQIGFVDAGRLARKREMERLVRMAGETGRLARGGER